MEQTSPDATLANKLQMGFGTKDESAMINAGNVRIAQPLNNEGGYPPRCMITYRQ
jgi:hypothetical protein